MTFDLTKFNNINIILYFKLYNPPKVEYDNNKHLCYTSVCLDRYDQPSDQPHLYGPDEIVITYTYWHKVQSNEQEKSPMLVLGHEYDKDVRPNWHEASHYYKYDNNDSDYDYNDSDDER